MNDAYILPSGASVRLAAPDDEDEDRADYRRHQALRIVNCAAAVGRIGGTVPHHVHADPGSPEIVLEAMAWLATKTDAAWPDHIDTRTLAFREFERAFPPATFWAQLTACDAALRLGLPFLFPVSVRARTASRLAVVGHKLECP